MDWQAFGLQGSPDRRNKSLKTAFRMIPYTEIYKLTKPVWTEADFEQMSWHDNCVHALSFVPEAREFVLDIDYIFAWVKPEPPSISYSFWISPVTLVFRDVSNFEGNIGEPFGLMILGVEREKNADGQGWNWVMNLLQGEMKYVSSGYSQNTRRDPVKCRAQALQIGEREGISFTRT